jgi:hypothetical protein
MEIPPSVVKFARYEAELDMTDIFESPVGRRAVRPAPDGVKDAGMGDSAIASVTRLSRRSIVDRCDCMNGCWVGSLLVCVIYMLTTIRMMCK